MRLIRWSVDHPAVVLAFYAGLLVAAALALAWWIPLRLTPALPSSLVGVVTESMGLPAEQVERLLTTPRERQLMQVPGVRAVRSQSMTGMSLIVCEFPFGFSMPEALTRVQAAAGEGSRVLEIDPLGIPVLRVAVRAPHWDPTRIRQFLESVAIPRLKLLAPVDTAYCFGGGQPLAQVMVDREKLRTRGLTMSDVRRALEGTQTQGAGWLTDITGVDRPVQALGPPRQVRDLETLPVTGNVTLREVATLTAGANPDASRYRCNGTDAVELNVVQRADASAPRTVAAVRQVLRELQRENPGLEFEEAYDNAHFVRLVGRDVWLELALGVMLTGLVVYFFWRDGRGTLIALATIPASLAAAVLAFVPLGLSLNSSTLVGLLLAIGRLVDDAIIDLHAVRRARAAGLEAREAAIEGCSEVRRAVIAATLVICLGMLPLTFAGGLTQAMFVGIVWPYLLTLAASLAVAMTLTPVLCARVYAGVPLEARPDPLEERYRAVLRWALRGRLLVLGGALAASYLACMLLGLVGSEMMPMSDTGQLYGVLEARSGATTQETARLAAQLEELLRKQPEVLRVSTEIGTEPPVRLTGYDAAGPSTARFFVTLTDRNRRTRSAWDVADAVYAQAWGGIPGMRRLALKEMGSDVMASAMAPIQLVIKGPELARLAWLAEETRDLGLTQRGLFQVSTAWDLERTGWRLDRVTNTTDLFLGLNGTPVQARLADGTPLMLALADSQRRSQRDLEQPATQVPAPTMIEHDGLQRCNSVMGSYRPGGPGSMRLSMDWLMASRLQLPYPQCFTIEQRGDMVVMMDSFARLLRGLGLALVLIYLTLAAQFRSPVVPLALMAAIPLELPGVLLALALAHQTISSVSLLGLVVLSGIDVTASILLLDAVLRRRAAGRTVTEALLEGAPSRVRPLLMTVAVTMAVMLPLALFPRPGMDAYAPLATVILGGLGASTLLSLLVVPVLFSLLHKR